MLSGGVGGAKLALGCARLLGDKELTIVANVGDDFWHLGLRICPDLDTLMYTLSGRVNTDSGWGRADEGWRFLESLAELGGPDWFRLGDRDLATHVLRSQRLRAGEPLSRITADFCRRLGTGQRLLPASDDPVATRVHGNGELLDFQDYFVRLRAKPAVSAIDYAGAENAQPAPGLLATLADRQLEAIVIAPSNPWLSIAPILAIPGIRQALRDSPAPVIAVSPIVAGRALKGPTAKIMAELGLEASATAVARYYRDLLDGFILDAADGSLAGELQAGGLPVRESNTIMNTLDDKRRLAAECLEFAAELRAGRR